jgi:hypothetical protein
MLHDSQGPIPPVKNNVLELRMVDSHKLLEHFNRGTDASSAVTHEAEITRRATPRLWLPVLVFLATLASSSQVPSSTAEIESPDLNLILQRLEDAQRQNPAHSRPYEVMREYKVFRGNDK